ncbi:MAG TPA: MBOAT family O-acyltransferase [Acetobacteraceae bacterium]|nr:MBOAT family O-acyltransferase [Acetobacteraceae bacterium]
MLFNSYLFVAGFLPPVFGGFWIACRIGPRAAAAWLLTASLLFYGWWNPAFLVLLLASIAGNYALGALILRTGNRQRLHSAILIFGIGANLGALAYYKYLGGVLAFLRLHSVAGPGFATPILPLGISFFTFTQLGYLLDCWQGQVKRDPPLLHYALFVSFFPHLIAGPILHHRELLPQFAERQAWRVDAQNVAVGSAIFLIGLLKKTLLADPISAPVAPGFVHPELLTLFPAWHVALSYSLQLYFDFSGYSDMAIGLARMFNLRFPVNFNAPYRSESVIDYWQRWHMTLTRWLMLYLYNPLALHLARRRAARGLPTGMEARRTLRGFAGMIAAPTLVTIGLAGIWHGSALTFVVFGLLHAAYLCVNHAWRLWHVGQPSTAPAARLGRVLLTYGCVLVGSVVFRAPDLSAAAQVLAGMFGVHGLMPLLPDAKAIARAGLDVLWLAGLYAIVWAAPTTQQIMRAHGPGPGRVTAGPLPRLLWQPTLGWAVAMGCGAALALLSIGGTGEFLYFQF